MLKLFYSAGSCSTSCHISLEEAGIDYQAIGVNWDDPNDKNISEVERLNPLGTLPILCADDGRILSQNVAIHTYVADLAVEKQLLPRFGSIERAEALNWLGFIAADLHKSFSPLFSIESMVKDSVAQSELRNWVIDNIQKHLKYLDRGLQGKNYLMGSKFTVADSYCFVVAGWSHPMNIPIHNYKNLMQYLERVSQRQAVQKVLKTEGLLDISAA